MELTDYFFNLFPTLFSWLREFYYSPFFSVIKFIIGIYTAVLLIDIVLILIHRGVSGDLKDTLWGMNLPAELVKPKSKSKLRTRWDKIKAKLESDNESDYKATIVEADNLVDNLLRRMNYPGENMEERLNNISPGQIENLDDLKRAHEVRKRVIQDKEFKIDKEAATDVLSVYEEFLRSYEVLD